MRYSGYACKDEDQNCWKKKRTTSIYFISFCCLRNLQQTQLNQLAFNIYTDFSIKDINKKPIRVEAFISVWDKIQERVSINISRRSANQNRRVEKSNLSKRVIAIDLFRAAFGSVRSVCLVSVSENLCATFFSVSRPTFS